MGALGVVVHGATGRVGGEILNALCRDPELEPVGAVSLDATGPPLALPDGSGQVPHATDLSSLLGQCSPSVVVDFTRADAALPMARIAIREGLHLVIGTSGMTPEAVAEIDGLSKERKVGAVIAPNFALGAVLMIHMAKLASRFFDYADIIELHHQTKIDAPSGTAISTARAMAQARGRPFEASVTEKENLPGTRGGNIEGVAIHSVRMQGLVAHQEVILGGLGQTLSIRHDTVGRECYVPGVLMAIREEPKRVGVVYGLESLLGLEEEA
ncbi:MAG: 4-hydroxy-tetrahydrodipicolinate reductase [Dehalococcoidia bacterium]